MPSIYGNTNTAIDRFSLAVREVLPDATFLQTQAVDPVFESMTTNDGNGDIQNLGRDYIIRRTYTSRIPTGEIQGDNLSGYRTLLGGDMQAMAGTKFAKPAASQAAIGYPNGLNGMMARSHRLNIPMYAMRGGLAMGMGLARLDALGANTLDLMAPYVEGFALNWARRVCNGFYANPAQGYRLAALPVGNFFIVSAGGSAAGDYILEFAPADGVTHRFSRGDQVDIWHIGDGTAASIASATRVNQTGTAQEKRVLVVVDDVDDINGKVFLRLVTAGSKNLLAEDGTTVDPLVNDANNAAAPISYLLALAATSLAGDTRTVSGATSARQFIVTPAHIRRTDGGSPSGFFGIASWRDWAKWGEYTAAAPVANDRYLLGANAHNDGGNANETGRIDVAERREFRSAYFPAFGSPTEQAFNRVFERIGNWTARYGHQFDTAIMSEGIKTAIYENRRVRETIVRGAGPASLGGMGLNDEFSFSAFGLKITPVVSRWFERGQMLIMRRQGNWAMVSPPTVDGVNRGGGGELGLNASRLPIEFPAPFLTGTDSIRFPVLNNGALTDFTYIPCHAIWQFVPREQIPMVLIDGIDNDTVFGS